MPELQILPLEELNLDLTNYRLLPKKSEEDSISALIRISPKKFWALFDDILSRGYLPAENLIVVKQRGESNQYRVLEGNRRVAALWLILQDYDLADFGASSSVIARRKALPQEVLITCNEVNCLVYSHTEIEEAEHQVALIHGKGEAASRERWNAVATARHNRDRNGNAEHALTLLEKFLRQSTKVTAEKKISWEGDYPLTVLGQAIQKHCKLFGAKSAKELAAFYPDIPHAVELDFVIKKIGEKRLGFAEVRADDFDVTFGPEQPQPPSGSSENSSDKTNQDSSSDKPQGKPKPSPQKPLAAKPSQATVKRWLREFKPRGDGREKVLELKIEMHKLKIFDNPYAFCFLLRSLFEVSEAAYRSEHRLRKTYSTGKKRGQVMTLTDRLLAALAHVESKIPEKGDELKALGRAKIELSTRSKILSIASMNDLIHDKNFRTSEGEIVNAFYRVVPLLKALNE